MPSIDKYSKEKEIRELVYENMKTVIPRSTLVNLADQLAITCKAMGVY
jgi:hypothetical protein